MLRKCLKCIPTSTVAEIEIRQQLKKLCLCFLSHVSGQLYCESSWCLPGFPPPSHQIFCFLLLKKKPKQGSGTCLLMLIYLLIFPPYFFKARLAPGFPKYVHVVNPVSLIHPLPPSNLSSTHISFLSAQGYSVIHSLHQTLSHSIQFPSAAVEIDRNRVNQGKKKKHVPRFTLLCSHRLLCLQKLRLFLQTTRCELEEKM